GEGFNQSKLDELCFKLDIDPEKAVVGFASK
ncbi:MAG: hypothetical protein ACI85U_000746, partial [Candidatus Promineifilaceae bacterium]